MAKLQREDLRRYAVLGAEQRLISLAQEAEEIYRTFPELRKTSNTRESSPRGRAASRRRRRRTMSAEGRKRISEAQKARWARQRGETAGSATGSRARKKK